ncbi:MAG: hypothetical protein IJ389_06905, partial [Clostridia bacterium]|nr:hypothetical protein [Clostridia bacterium]
MKRIIAFFIALVTLWATAVYAVGAYVSGHESLDTENAIKLDIINDSDWSSEYNVDSISVRRSGSSNALYIVAESRKASMAVSYEPEKMLELSEYNELCFDVSVTSKGKCSITVKYHYPAGTYEDTAEGISSGRSLVRFKLPEEAAQEATAITLTITSESILQSCTVLGVYADDFRSYSYIDLFESNKIEIPVNAVSEDDRINIVASKEPSYVTCYLEAPYEGEAVLVTVRVASPFGGIITAVGDETGEARSSALYKGEAEYSFLLPKVYDTVKLGFSAGEADGVNSVTILSLDTVNVREIKGTVGSVESCTYDGKKVRLKGSIPSDTVVEHIKAKLALYKIPYDSDAPYELKEAEAEISISTSFTLSASVDYDHTRYKYLIALVEKKNITPITAPVYAYESSESPVVSQGCAVGLSNAGAVTVFASEAQRVVLDVFPSKLLSSSSEGGKTLRYNYQDSVYYFDRDRLDELESQISFCTSADTSVFLRLMCDSEEMTDQYENMLCAAASCLAEKFPDAEAMIFLSEYPYKGDAASAMQASELLARLKGAVRHKAPGCGIMMSVSEDQTASAVMTAYYNKYNCVKNVGMYFECKMSEGNVVKATVIADSASSSGSGFKNITIFYRDFIESQYKIVYDAATKADIASVIYCMEGFTDGKTSELVNDLKSSKTVVYDFDILSQPHEYTGTCSLWDFRNSYDTFGWLSGGSCLAPYSVVASDGEGRAMRSVISPAVGGSGILVCRLDEVTDISRADTMN